jgi:hypothetical protein
MNAGHSFALFAKGGIIGCSRQDLFLPRLPSGTARTPDFLLRTPPPVACAVPARRDRMKCVVPTKLYRKSGGMGHPAFALFISSAAEGSAAPEFYERNRLESL